MPSLNSKLSLARASSEWSFSDTGALLQYGSNMPSWDGRFGLPIYTQRTNSIRNPRCEGAIVGSPGTDPTHWARAQVNCTSEITVTGETNGIPWVEYAVTATGAGDWRVNFEGSSGPPSFPVTPGSLWSGSVAVAHTAALPAQVTTTSIRSPSSTVPIVSISVPTDGVPSIRTASFVGNTTIASTPLAYFIQFNGACTFTVRVGLPNMENNAGFVSPPILPPIGAPAASTRLATNISASLSSFGISESGACTISGRFLIPHSQANKNIIQIDNGTPNRFFLRCDVATIILYRGLADVYSSNAATIVAINTPINFALTIGGTGTAAASINGGAAVLVAGGPISGLTNLRVGKSVSITNEFLNGYIQRLRITPTPVAVSALPAISAAV